MEISEKKLIDFLGELSVGGWEQIDSKKDPESYILTAFLFHPESNLDEIYENGFNDVRLYKDSLIKLQNNGFLKLENNRYSVTESGIEYLTKSTHNNFNRRN